MSQSSEEVDWAFDDSKRYPISNDYQVGKQLGEGKFSVVKYAVHKQSKAEVAIKCIDRINTNPDELVHEAMLLQMVEDHPGIIKIKDVYEDPKLYYLVMEYVPGGELFDRIVEQDSYTEKEASGVIRQICRIVEYVHSKKIVHRDIKPENLLCADRVGTQLRLCDFGLADTIEDDELLTAVVGSTTYMAPEVAKGIGYDKSVDMYSIGVILYILLCGYPPFEPESGIVDLEFPAKEWGDISKSVINLITNMLSSKSHIRPTATQILCHPWIKGESVSNRNLRGTINTIRIYQKAVKTGQTMRTKDPVTQRSVLAPGLFDEPAPGSRVNSTKTLADSKSSSVPVIIETQVAPVIIPNSDNTNNLHTKGSKRPKGGKSSSADKKAKRASKKKTASGASSGEEEAKKNKEIKNLQKEIEVERKKIRHLEARIVELEKKAGSKSRSPKKKSK